MIPFDSKRAPSPSAVLPYYAVAAVVFLATTILMLLSFSSFLGHYFQPHILAITHLAALGWGTMIIFGASHQLLPVVMEVHLFSEKLAKYCFITLFPGMVLLVYSFWTFSIGWMMETGALLVLTAVVLYVTNVYRTAAQNERWTVTAECIVTASWWLLLTAILGAVLVLNLRYAFLPREHLYYLKIHAHLGLAGWFLLLIMGVASRLIPMFLLSHHEPGMPVKAAYYCVNIALIVFLVTAFFFNTEKFWPVCAAIALAGVVCYGKFVRDAYKGAMRKKLDVPMKMTLAAILLLVVPFLLLAVLVFLRAGAQPVTVAFTLAYGISMLGGFITALILGQTFKTLPFIVWMHRYKKLIGKVKTPLPRELYREGWVKLQFYSYVAGYFILLAGVLCRARWLIGLGCAALLVAAIGYNVNVWFTILHRVKGTAPLSKKEPDQKA